MKFRVRDGYVRVPEEFLNFDPVFYNENPEGRPTTSFPIPSGSVLTTIMTREIEVPEECGAVIRATIRAINGAAANDCFYDVSMDGTIVRAHGFNLATGPSNSEGSLQKVIREITPGRHVFTMNAQSNLGVGVIAEMTIELRRSTNLAVN